MKLSSLNRFKNKTVELKYQTRFGETKELSGLVEEVAPNGLTLDFSKGLIKVELNEIVSIIELSDKATSPLPNFFEATNTQKSSKIKVMVPVSKDGSYFNPSLKTISGEYKLGEKGEEFTVTNFFSALEKLKEMEKPRWRRPSATSGVPSIVIGIKWEEKEFSSEDLK